MFYATLPWGASSLTLAVMMHVKCLEVFLLSSSQRSLKGCWAVLQALCNFWWCVACPTSDSRFSSLHFWRLTLFPWCLRTMSGRRLREAVKKVSCWGRGFSRAQHIWNFTFLDSSGFSFASCQLGSQVPHLTDVSFSQLLHTHSAHAYWHVGEMNILPKRSWSSFNPLSQHKIIQLGSRHNWC